MAVWWRGRESFIGDPWVETLSETDEFLSDPWMFLTGLSIDNIFLNTCNFLQQQRPQMGTTESEFAGSGEYHQTNTDPTTWDNPASDPDLSEILDQVIDFVPDQSSAGNYNTD